QNPPGTPRFLHTMKPFVLIKRVDLEDSEHVKAEDNNDETGNAIKNLQPGLQKEPDPCGSCTQSNERDRKPDYEHDRVDQHRSLEAGVLCVAFELVERVTRND